MIKLGENKINVLIKLPKRNPSGQVIIGDARYEIRKLKGPYDLIILDVFTGGSEPTHLLTVETLTQLRTLLSDQGMLALNFVAFFENGQNAALASVSKTIAEVFCNCLSKDGF